jgi:hypothetical protein
VILIIPYLFYYLGLPDSKAWGKRRSKYYGGDVEDEDWFAPSIKQTATVNHIILHATQFTVIIMVF